MTQPQSAENRKVKINRYDISLRLLEAVPDVKLDMKDTEVFESLSESKRTELIKREIIYGRRMARMILNKVRETGESITQEKIRQGISIFYRDNSDVIGEVEKTPLGRGYLSRLVEEFSR